ncbi:MAG: phage portal protein [Thermoguttaceae bacterium]|nr:phage portal protein [Thermoguttaceae bacterium]
MLNQGMREIVEEFFRNLLPPSEFYDDAPGHWRACMSGTLRDGCIPWQTEGELDEVRLACRELAMTNEFAINGHENRISYIVGSGYSCKVIPRSESDCELSSRVQSVLDEFMSENHWYRRQQEIVRRMDRDGEAFLRFFEEPDGIVRVRFVEPSQVRTPPERASDPDSSFGVWTASHDPELVRGYFVKGELVSSTSIQHRKANVDESMKRGVPLFYPVMKNLQRAEKILRNMSVVAGVQSAIAIIRKHTQGNPSTVRQFVQNEANANMVDASGQVHSYRRYSPGTILDASSGVEYEFPASTIDASSFVSILQAELRAVASRLVMPEFMLTSDASNANYSSTMVAEGPCVRTFQRLQQEMVEEDTRIFRRVISHAVRAGRLPREALSRIRLLCVPPNLVVRNRLQEAQADEILLRCGVLSPQTMALRHGIDPEKES